MQLVFCAGLFFRTALFFQNINLTESFLALFTVDNLLLNAVSRIGVELADMGYNVLPSVVDRKPFEGDCSLRTWIPP